MHQKVVLSHKRIPLFLVVLRVQREPIEAILGSKVEISIDKRTFH